MADTPTPATTSLDPTTLEAAAKACEALAARETALAKRGLLLPEAAAQTGYVASLCAATIRRLARG